MGQNTLYMSLLGSFYDNLTPNLSFMNTHGPLIEGMALLVVRGRMGLRSDLDWL